MFGKNINKVLKLFVVAFVGTLVVSSGFALAAGHHGGGSSDETAELRVVHASPDAPDVDVYVDGNVTLEGVGFKTVSDYLELPTGNHTVEITAADSPDTSVFGPARIDFGANHYTAVAVGELSDEGQEFEVLVLQDNNSAPGEEDARLRLLHASPDAPNVDVTVQNGPTLFSNVSYGESGYVEVPTGNYTVQVRPNTPNNNGSVVAEYNLSLEANTVYSAFAVGYLTPDDEPSNESFDLVTSVDFTGTSDDGMEGNMTDGEMDGDGMNNGTDDGMSGDGMNNGTDGEMGGDGTQNGSQNATDGGSQGSPGFTAVVALVALLSVVLLSLRRRN